MYKHPVENVIQFKPRQKAPEEQYQLFKFESMVGIYRIAWIDKLPARVEYFAAKDWTWVQLQRYKERELINMVADWEKYSDAATRAEYYRQHI